MNHMAEKGEDTRHRWLCSRGGTTLSTKSCSDQWPHSCRHCRRERLGLGKSTSFKKSLGFCWHCQNSLFC